MSALSSARWVESIGPRGEREWNRIGCQPADPMVTVNRFAKQLEEQMATERFSDPHLDGLTQGQAAAYGEATGQLPASQPIDKQNKVQLGRIVHFTRTAGATCQASLVVHVWDKTGVNGCANLAVFNGNGALEAATATSVVRRKDGDAFGWHWPQECPAS